MKVKPLYPLLAATFVAFLSYCAVSPPESYVVSERYPTYGTAQPNPSYNPSYSPSARSNPYAAPSTSRRPTTVRTIPTRTASSSQLKVGLNLKAKYMPRSARGRSGRSMSPRYITIHSTQNWSQGADAYRHSLALNRGKLGKISWHFTTDENVAIQHLPTTEEGNHAENYRGPGNQHSIGIEMCEHPGNSKTATIERTAKLTAYLMKKHNIPLRNVKPHYHWPRPGKNPPNKNCP